MSKQNYEALDGIVNPKAIKVLKHRINRLTPGQQELINIDPELFGFFVRSLSLKRMKGDFMLILPYFSLLFFFSFNIIVL